MRKLFNFWRRFNHGVVYAMLLMVVVVVVIGSAGLRFNDTTSLPIGLYRSTSEPSPYIEFCIQGPWEQLSIDRGYRESSIVCHDGGAPLMKIETGKPGDTITLTKEGAYLNGQLLRNTAPRSYDSRGRPMMIYPFGSYNVPSNYVWPMSTWNPKSFDARYFGPIHRSQIILRLKPLLLFQKGR